MKLHGIDSPTDWMREKLVVSRSGSRQSSVTVRKVLK